jgi:transketolase
MSMHGENSAAAHTADLAPAADDLDGRAVTTLRLLAADMVESARSGHPGMPLGAAPMAWALWSRHLRHDPSCPDWAGRDRFVLSAGHASALLYGLLHLSGYDLPLAELRRFRQLDSATPGHPEFGHTPGVETTTGPLGQGLANAVGMALAERMLHARFGPVAEHRTYALVGDGCLMEGISHEAASLAGKLRLGRLVVLYDSNDITIDGPASQSCTDDAAARFAAYGWHTLTVRDGNDIDEIDRAIAAANADERPSLIVVPTVIGYGTPGVAGTPKAHGNPLGPDTLTATRRGFGWPDEAFHIPADVAAYAGELAAAGAATRQRWEASFTAWAADHPEAAAAWHQAHAKELPGEVGEALAAIPTQTMATRQASARVLSTLGPLVPQLVGGSADLAGSTGTDAHGGAAVTAEDFGGSTIHFGIREHGMAAVLNGMAAHGGFRPYGSTFLVFSDYLRPSLRLSALMGLPVIYLLTHDSIAVGEDGPTHQPVEHVESLRLIPRLAVLRPADCAETISAWHAALSRTDSPSALILTRQSVPDLGTCAVDTVARFGARVVGDNVEAPLVTILSSGSEVTLAITAARDLTAAGTPTRVVSVPWRERFASLSDAERSALTGGARIIVAVEAGVPHGWAGLTGSPRRVLGLSDFGASGPADAVLERFGMTSAAVVDLVRRELSEATAVSHGILATDV